MFRYRKNLINYRQQLDPSGCPFCYNINPKDIVHSGEHFYIMQNQFPYDVWEMRNVKNHLLLIPKKHIRTLDELPQSALVEYARTLSDYQSHDYNTYARSSKSPQLTVPQHQHTHLISTESKKARFGIISLRPYFMIKIG